MLDLEFGWGKSEFPSHRNGKQGRIFLPLNHHSQVDFAILEQQTQYFIFNSDSLGSPCPGSLLDCISQK